MTASDAGKATKSRKANAAAQPPELAQLMGLSDDAIAALPFETAYGWLEVAVGLLEAGELPLEAAMDAYQRGVSLARRCECELEVAELRIREVEG